MNARTQQTLGCTKSWTLEFKKFRDSRVSRIAAETNALLLRLEKLICIPPLTRLERREAEQSVVPWISFKVDLCPSCGSRFGLSAEDYFTQNTESLPDNDAQTKKPSITQFTKNTLFTIGSAILDYNPVFRRRHHCRLCGHVLCADCSFFLDRKSGIHLMQMVDQNNLGHYSDSHNEIPGSTNPQNDLVQFTREVKGLSPLFDLDRDPICASYWRVCSICKHIIEKKIQRLTEHKIAHPVVRLHTDMKNLMCKVNEAMPSYTTIANSLHSGEQRYALEMAKTARHELLDWLQQIDQLRRQMNQLEASTTASKQPTAKPNLALIRLIRAINKVASHFIQVNLPPLRVLPTTRQYDSLAVQRQEQLASRWAEEERTISELERCLLDSRRNSPRNSIQQLPSSSMTSKSTSPKQEEHVAVGDLNRLAARIDEASANLMNAKQSANSNQIIAWTKKLNRREREFQSASKLLQFNQ